MSTPQPSAALLTAFREAPVTIPPLSKTDLFRMRLVQEINAGVSRKLTLLTAPSGFGKTTLASQWASQSLQKVAWLTVSADHNDPAVFLDDMIRALQSVHPQIGSQVFQTLQSAERPPIETILQRMIDEMGLVVADFVLVIDDYEQVGNSAVHNMLNYFLQRLPLRMHLLLISQFDPPFSLSKMRANEELKELRSPYLAFLMEEGSAYINETLGMNIPFGDLTALVAATKAHPGLLKFAGLYLQSLDDKPDYIKEFEKSEEPEFNFTVEKCFDNLPANTQELIMKTAVAGVATPGLLQSLTGFADAADTLAELADRGLFINRLHRDQPLYRVPPFLEPWLNKRIAMAFGDQEKETQLRCSLWYAKNALISQAIALAISAEADNLAAEYIEANAMGLLSDGRLYTVRNWLATIPTEVIRKRPRSALTMAWILVIEQDFDGVNSYLNDAEAALDSDAAAGELKENITAVREFLANMPGKKKGR